MGNGGGARPGLAWLVPILPDRKNHMSAYAVANLTHVRMGPEIVTYLERIDATLAPFGGRFVIHGGPPAVAAEGEWAGDLIMIEFPDLEHATGWYASPAYQAILPLRTEHAEGVAVIFDGVEAGHKATDVLAA